MATPDRNRTGQLYLQQLPPPLQMHTPSGGMSVVHAGNYCESEGVNMSNTNMFLRQRTNAVSIRARRNREEENRTR